VRCSGWYHGCDDHRADAVVAEDAAAAAAADVVEGQRAADTLFWFDEAVFEDTALLLGDEGKDHLYATAAARCLQQAEESTFPVEESAAPRISPGNQDHRVGAEAAEPKKQVQEEEAKGVAVDVPAVVPEQRNDVPPVTSPEKNVSIQGKKKSPRCSILICFLF
jgi:hypothetical protein